MATRTEVVWQEPRRSRDSEVLEQPHGPLSFVVRARSALAQKQVGDELDYFQVVRHIDHGRRKPPGTNRIETVSDDLGRVRVVSKDEHRKGRLVAVERVG